MGALEPAFVPTDSKGPAGSGATVKRNTLAYIIGRVFTITWSITAVCFFMAAVAIHFVIPESLNKANDGRVARWIVAMLKARHPVAHEHEFIQLVSKVSVILPLTKRAAVWSLVLFAIGLVPLIIAVRILVRRAPTHEDSRNIPQLAAIYCVFSFAGVLVMRYKLLPIYDIAPKVITAIPSLVTFPAIIAWIAFRPQSILGRALLPYAIVPERRFAMNGYDFAAAGAQA